MLSNTHFYFLLPFSRITQTVTRLPVCVAESFTQYSTELVDFVDTLYAPPRSARPTSSPDKLNVKARFDQAFDLVAFNTLAPEAPAPPPTPRPRLTLTDKRVVTTLITRDNLNFHPALAKYLGVNLDQYTAILRDPTQPLTRLLRTVAKKNFARDGTEHETDRWICAGESTL